VQTVTSRQNDNVNFFAVQSLEILAGALRWQRHGLGVGGSLLQAVNSIILIAI